MVNINDPKPWGEVKKFDGIPNNVDKIMQGMTIITIPKTYSFSDMFGNRVEMPLNDTRPYYAEGYYRAAWDLRNNNLRLSEDGETLYRRDVDMSGELKKLRSWHEVASIDNEYGVPAGRQRIKAWNLLIRNEAKNNPPVLRGMRFGEKRACYRDGPTIKFVELEPYDDTAYVFHEEKELPEDSDSIKWMNHTAKQWASWLTADQHSADNLIRMFATPFLEPYKHLTYVLYGGGGNGKGILLGRMAKQYPNYASTFNTKRFADGKGFTAEQESRKIIGKYWLFDEEADVLDQESMTQIKRLSTGESIVARKIGENAMTFKPKATLTIATNEPFISSQVEASTRRFSFVRMKEGRKAEDFQAFINYLDTYGIVPFLLASCILWSKSDDPWTDVSIGGQDDMTDSEEWVRDAICSQGYAISAENPFGKRFSTKSRDKLGLSSTVKWVDNKAKRVLVVNDEKRFAPYRKLFDSDMKKLEATDNQNYKQQFIETYSKPSPIKANSAQMIDPQTYGFICKLAPAEAHGENQKKSYTWASAKPNSNNQKERLNILNHQQAYAVVPDTGFMVIDMDTGDKENGWDIFNSQVGEYLSEDFPKTYIVQSPSGGIHAYYKIPKEYIGKLKNVAHPGGIPIDLRLENKGYIIGAMSIVDKGEYSLCDIPDHNVPELTNKMIEWLKAHDYFESAIPHKAIDLPKASGEKAEPDMSPIPEGQRNQVLHSWAYGRLLNHPENRQAIQEELFARGRASGLKDQEISTIWKSILNKIG